jgi:hypothetical protein
MIENNHYRYLIGSRGSPQGRPLILTEHYYLIKGGIKYGSLVGILGKGSRLRYRARDAPTLDQLEKLEDLRKIVWYLRKNQ